MTTPETTVYIVSHNYGKFLTDAIESVLRQTCDSWELLLIDDNSKDNTSEIMNRYQADPRVRLFKTAGVGLPAICNLAMKEAKGRFLIRLDGDDVVDENIVLVLSNYLKRYPDVALVFPDYYLIDELGEVFGQERREKLYSFNHTMDLPAHGACTLARVEVLKKLGGYREDLGAQDGFDLWSRILKEHKAGNVNIPLFYYRRHTHNLTNNAPRILNARRTIKLDGIREELDCHRPVIAVIPCRRNYDFIPDVWKQDLSGQTLLQRAIGRCVRSPIFDHIVVACDNEEVQTTIDKFKDPRVSFFKRDSAMTIRSQSIVPSLEKIVSQFDPERKGLTVLTYVQAPFVTTEGLEEAVSTLLLNHANSAMGVTELSVPTYKRTAHGLQPVNAPGSSVTTDFHSLYCDSNTALVARSHIFRGGSLTGPLMVNYVVSADEAFFVDSNKALRVARILAEER